MIDVALCNPTLGTVGKAEQVRWEEELNRDGKKG